MKNIWAEVLKRALNDLSLKPSSNDMKNIWAEVLKRALNDLSLKPSSNDRKTAHAFFFKKSHRQHLEDICGILELQVDMVVSHAASRIEAKAA